MKQLCGLLLVLSMTQVSSFAQSKLVLRVDPAAQTLDWVDGYSISNKPEVIGGNVFGFVVLATARISSPLLNYTGDGAHEAILFQFSENRSRIDGINLVTSVPPLTSMTFSGTAEGPKTPTFTLGDFTAFSQLTPGGYTLPSFNGNWDGVIEVQVVPEPASMALMAAGLGMIVLLRVRRKVSAQA